MVSLKMATLVDGGVEADIVNPVVRRKLKAVGPGDEGDCSVAAFTAQRLLGRKADGWRVGQIAVYRDMTNVRNPCGRDQLLDRVDGLHGGCCFRNAHLKSSHGTKLSRQAILFSRRRGI